MYKGRHDGLSRQDSIPDVEYQHLKTTEYKPSKLTSTFFMFSIVNDTDIS